MRVYNVGPKVELPNGDTVARSLGDYACRFIDADSPAQARKVYAEKTGYAGKTKAEFICVREPPRMGRYPEIASEGEAARSMR